MKTGLISLCCALIFSVSSLYAQDPAATFDNGSVKKIVDSLKSSDGKALPEAKPAPITVEELEAIARQESNIPQISFPPAAGKEEYCSKAKDPDYFKTMLYDPQNQMGFENQGGIFNGGVCWWHSRFQRSAAYLTIYRPDLPKPDRAQAMRIIRNIVSNGDILETPVSEIPGYHNLSEFSRDWEKDIQDYLNAWEKREGIVGAGWIRGLLGTYIMAPERLKAMMDRIYEEVEGRKNIAYVKLQLPGIDSHAELVVHMKRTDFGYVLYVVDSNRPGYVISHIYLNGSRQGMYCGGVYIEEIGAMRKIRRAINDYCGFAQQ